MSTPSTPSLIFKPKLPLCRPGRSCTEPSGASRPRVRPDLGEFRGPPCSPPRAPPVPRKVLPPVRASAVPSSPEPSTRPRPTPRSGTPARPQRGVRGVRGRPLFRRHEERSEVWSRPSRTAARGPRLSATAATAGERPDELCGNTDGSWGLGECAWTMALLWRFAG